jgi:hypothetical protein
MPEKRRVAFAESLSPNFYEWDAVMEEETTVEECRALTAKTLVVSDDATRLPIREIVGIFGKSCPHWTFAPSLRADIWLRSPIRSSSIRSFVSSSTAVCAERARHCTWNMPAPMNPHGPLSWSEISMRMFSPW